MKVFLNLSIFLIVLISNAYSSQYENEVEYKYGKYTIKDVPKSKFTNKIELETEIKANDVFGNETIRYVNVLKVINDIYGDNFKIFKYEFKNKNNINIYKITKPLTKTKNLITASKILEIAEIVTHVICNNNNYCKIEDLYPKYEWKSDYVKEDVEKISKIDFLPKSINKNDLKKDIEYEIVASFNENSTESNYKMVLNALPDIGMILNLPERQFTSENIEDYFIYLNDIVNLESEINDINIPCSFEINYSLNNNNYINPYLSVFIKFNGNLDNYNFAKNIGYNFKNDRSSTLNILETNRGKRDEIDRKLLDSQKSVDLLENMLKTEENKTFILRDSYKVMDLKSKIHAAGIIRDMWSKSKYSYVENKYEVNLFKNYNVKTLPQLKHDLMNICLNL
jgi:hypothetical protein